MWGESNLIQVVEILKSLFTPITVIRRMLFLAMVLQTFFSRKDERTVIAFVPMISLLMLQAEPPIMGRPPLKTPATFDLVSVTGTVIEVITDGVIRVEVSATALMHRSFRARKTKVGFTLSSVLLE